MGTPLSEWCRPDGHIRGQKRGLTRRALFAGTAAASAACSPVPGLGRRGAADSRVVVPTPTAIRFGRLTLRLALAGEGHAPLDAAVQAVLSEAAGKLGASVSFEPWLGETGDQSPFHRLLVAVQAGVPPDAVGLNGRAAQTVRFQAFDLVQDVSALLRRLKSQYGSLPAATEHFHVVAGTWFAVPHYQRLIGHWVRASALRTAGAGVMRDLADVEGVRRVLARVSAAARSPAWGIGGADTRDVDAWTWWTIHAWGGGVADFSGRRVTVAEPPLADALRWLAETLASAPIADPPDGPPPPLDGPPPPLDGPPPPLDGPPAGVPASAASWTDAEKNAAFVSGATAYTFTDRLLAGSGSSAPTADALADAMLLPAPAGPTGPGARPRTTGGGAVWYLPRGVQADSVEPLLEAALTVDQQRRLWISGQGLAVPAFTAGWDDSSIGALPAVESVRRFRDELTNGGFPSGTGNGGPETAASQAIGAARLGAGMLRAVLAGRTIEAVLAEAQAQAAQVYRDLGFPGG